MEKTNYLREPFGGQLGWKPILLRIGLLCMFFMCLGTSTSVVQAQNAEKISVVVREKTIAEILNIIEKKTQCVFLYDVSMFMFLFLKIAKAGIQQRFSDVPRSRTKHEKKPFKI